MYGYSGLLDINSLTTMLEFNTGNYITVALLQLTGDWDSAGPNFADLTVNFNGQTILKNKERRDLGDLGMNAFYSDYTSINFSYCNGVNSVRLQILLR